MQAPRSDGDSAELRVVLVEDDRSYRDSMRTVLGLTPGIALNAGFGSVEDAIAGATRRRDGRRAIDGWDLVLMDIELPGTSGVEGTRALKALHPRLQVVMLTTFEDPDVILQAICAGADGYVLKKTPLPEVPSPDSADPGRLLATVSRGRPHDAPAGSWGPAPGIWGPRWARAGTDGP